eukprot:403347509
MESNKTQYLDELMSLDVLEQNVIANGEKFFTNLFQETKQKFANLFELQKKQFQIQELTQLFQQWSDVVAKEQITYDKFNQRLMELQNVIQSYFQCNKSGSSLRQHVTSNNFCLADLKTLRIIKLLQLHYDKIQDKANELVGKQNSVIEIKPQIQQSKPSDQTLSQLSMLEKLKNKNGILPTSSLLMNSQQVRHQQQHPPVFEEEKSSSLHNLISDLNIRQEDINFSQAVNNQEEFKMPSSILQSREETKNEILHIQQFGAIIKKAIWVFENDEAYKQVIYTQSQSDPIFFTKQVNQDVQFGFRVLNHEVVQAKKLVKLKDVDVNFANINFVEIDGQGFQHLPSEINQDIEQKYQKFLNTKQDTSTNLVFHTDVYRVDFSEQLFEMYEILNVNTNQGRILKRFEIIQMPCIQFKVNDQIKWRIKSTTINSILKNYFENTCTEIFSNAYKEMLIQKKDVTKYLPFTSQTTYCFNLIYSESFTQGLIINTTQYKESYVIELISGFSIPAQLTQKFDYITTFDPKSQYNQQKLLSLNLQNKDNFKLKLNENEAEYIYIKNLFLESFRKGRVSIYDNAQINSLTDVVKIEKIFNKSLYERFTTEIKFMKQKYPEKEFEDMLQHLFHGSRNVDPSLIYDSSIGFDFRLSGDGCLYGRGAYFAKHSGYSDNYRFMIHSTSECQIFVALVLTGNFVTLNKNDPNLKAPPYKPGSQTERYDSVHNGQLDHFIVYDHYRAYPGYLITY